MHISEVYVTATSFSCRKSILADVFFAAKTSFLTHVFDVSYIAIVATVPEWHAASGAIAENTATSFTCVGTL